MPLILLIALFFCLSACTQQTANAANHNVHFNASIEQVAEKYINILFQNDDWYLFRIDLPAQAILTDHMTGPRLIVLLTDLSGQRIADDSPVTAHAKQVFYLENPLSKGFKNSANATASYLVMPVLGDKPVREFNKCSMPGFNLLVEKSPIVVCESKYDAVIEGTANMLWYSNKTSMVKIIPDRHHQSIAAGDFIFKIPPNTLPVNENPN